MRKITINGLLILVLVTVVSYSVNAQTKAITETGDEVLLFADGTWKYINEEVIEDKEISVNEKKFEKDDKSSFLVKSKILNVGIWINPKEWKFQKGTNDAAEFEFTLKGEDLYGMLITEKVEIPVESLKIIAVENARDVAPDIKIIEEEYRYVNGNKLLMLQLSGTVQGMKVTYRGYYYSNENGTYQFITYTATNLFKDYTKEIETLLNGVVII